jgi:hypothetical protein
MLLSVYLGGWLVTAICVWVAADLLRDPRRPRPYRFGSLAVLSSALWPVLVIGVVELLAIRAVVETTMRAASARGPNQALVESDDELIST